MASEQKLVRCGPLDGWVESWKDAGSDDLRIESPPSGSVINLRAAPSDDSLVTDVLRVLGVELPLLPNRWNGDERLAAVWLAPEEWLLLAPDGAAGEIERAVREARPTDPWLSLVNLSHNYTCLRLSGHRARDLLAAGCALDLRWTSFGAGDCVQTILAKANVILRATSEGSSIELWSRNSWARYLAAWLDDARSALRY